MDIFAPPVQVQDPKECFFYHSLDLPVSGFQKGQWDLRQRFDEYVAGYDVRGKSVLDVGTASGFLSFEAEKRGAAQVVSVDAASARYWQQLPFVQNESFKNPTKWLAESEPVLESIKRSYWLAHREYGSKAQAYYGNIYDLPETLGQYDVVIVGQILVHLSDAITALASVARRCRHTCIIAERIVTRFGIYARSPQSFFLGRQTHPEVGFTFWHHTSSFYIEVMGMLGFEPRGIQHHKFICNVPTPKEHKITTMIFERRPPA